MDKNLAIETLKSFVENTDNVIAKDAILTLHPELAESEDERIREFLIGFIKLENGVNLSPDDAERCIAYLEKQKEQKPAEWSEEDKVELFNIIDFLNSPSTAKLCPALRRNAISWLESLRPQPHWKPSNEQIDALERAIIKMHAPKDIGILAELRDILKKL